MTAKNLFIGVIVFLLMAMFGCFGTVGDQPPATVGTQACYADAAAQLSPQWAAGPNMLDRAAAAFSVISICEGTNQP